MGSKGYLFRTPQRLNCFGVLPSQGSDFSVVDRYSILFYNPGAVTISNKFSSGMEGLPCGSSVNRAILPWRIESCKLVVYRSMKSFSLPKENCTVIHKPHIGFCTSSSLLATLFS
ncbi:uncharacterized protein LOC113356344 [Papaver somniferum]|uniref:uncharacterized protein LOC113356344 n=1 Tax=Papaver somniferum TaxID=3469 RepID=UPI000E700F0E|nr:uncharacterized protein LOC113356344 [Papaver somniferum]